MTSNSFDDVSKFYDEVYYDKIDISNLSISKHTRNLAKRFISPGMQVLDVACGTGEFLFASTQFGGLPSGIDISEKATAVCRKLMPDGDFFTGPAEKLPFDNDRFDVVTCLGSLEHFLEQNRALKEMLRVAKPGAVIIILVPNADFLTRKLGLFGGTGQTRIKEDVKTLDEWQKLFNEAGMDVTERWKDLHVLSRKWIFMRGVLQSPVRLLQAVCLMLWPLKWQYQVYHLCKPSDP